MIKNRLFHQPQAVLWDMDGVLLQSDHLWKNGFINETLENGHQWSSIDTTACRGKTNNDITLHLATIFDLNLAQKIVKNVEDSVVANITPALISPRAIEVLTYYYNKEIPMAIVTSSLPEVVQALERLLPLPFFKQKITSLDVTKGKPDPQGYLLAAKYLKVDIEHSLVFEDSDSGIQAGINSKAHVVAMPKSNNFQPNSKLTIVKDLEDWHTRFLLEQ